MVSNKFNARKHATPSNVKLATFVMHGRAKLKDKGLIGG